MPRTSLVAPSRVLFYVLNRGAGWQRSFNKPADYLAFEELLEETLAKQPRRFFRYCLMPNRCYFALWPEHDRDLAAFMPCLTVTHVTRWQKRHGRVGKGHVYQGRFKSFPVETEDYFYQVERNALRANLVAHAEDWPWSILCDAQNKADRTL